MIDFDRVYEPEQLDQLAKDLVRGRGRKLDPFEKASLARWKRQGLSARIRRLPDRSMTCWPTDLPTQPGSSHIGGRRTSPAKAMAFLREEEDYKVSIGARFDKSDLDTLRAAALTEKEDWFKQAVSAIERDSYLVIRVMDVDELKEIVARFADVGVTHITLDDLRVGDKQPVRT